MITHDGCFTVGVSSNNPRSELTLFNFSLTRGISALSEIWFQNFVQKVSQSLKFNRLIYFIVTYTNTTVKPWIHRIVNDVYSSDFRDETTNLWRNLIAQQKLVCLLLVKLSCIKCLLSLSAFLRARPVTYVRSIDAIRAIVFTHSLENMIYSCSCHVFDRQLNALVMWSVHQCRNVGYVCPLLTVTVLPGNLVHYQVSSNSSESQ